MGILNIYIFEPETKPFVGDSKYCNKKQSYSCINIL